MGYLFAVLSALCYGLVPTFQSIAMMNHMRAEDVVLFGYLFCLGFTWIICLIKKVKPVYTAKEIFRIVIVALFGYFATELLLNLAYERLPAGMVTAIHFSYPAVVCAINCLFFHAKFTFQRFAALVLSAMGLVCICYEEFAAEMVGLLFALGSAFTFSFMFLYSERSGLHKMEENRKFLVVYAVCAVSASVLRTMPGSKGTIGILGIGSVALAGVLLLAGDLFLSLGIKKIGSTSAAFFSVLEPIVSLGATMLVMNTSFSVFVLLGSALIAGSLVFSILADQSNSDSR